MKLIRLPPRLQLSPWALLRFPALIVIRVISQTRKKTVSEEEADQRKRRIFSGRVKEWQPVARVTQHLEARRTARKEAEQQEMTDLTNLIDHNIETIISLHMRAELKVSSHQRLLERVATLFGRPVCLYTTLVIVIFWITVNLIAPRLGLEPLDPAPFAWLQSIMGIIAMIMTILVLITQNRQAKLAERHKHLDLQVGLIVEHKVSKLIALVEELRHDIPIVKDRYDHEAEVMKEAIDPKSVFLTLDETLEEVDKEVEQTIVQSSVVFNVETLLSKTQTDEESE